MSTEVYPVAQKTAKPIVAGIFNIVIGSGCMLGVLGLGLFAAFTLPFVGDPFRGDFFFSAFVFPMIGVPLAVLGVLSIIGGIFGIQRRHWGWALVGSIAAAFTSTLLGIASIVLIAVSKDEFSQ
jgi:hypothetical protein